MKSKALGLCVLLILSLFLGACQQKNKPSTETVYIDDYVLCVEEAIGDRYNVRIRYSLKRQDGADIDPDAQFDSITNHDLKRSTGGSIRYSLSDNGKIIWIEEVRSSSSKYDSREVHTVTFENLSFGEKSGHKPIEGTWDVSFKIQINEEYIELLDSDLKIQSFENGTYFCQLSSIQISSMGIHMEMKIPDNDIHNLVNNFKAELILENGSTIELELHHSIRGKENPFDASGETMFERPVELDEVYALIACGQEIIAPQKNE